MVEKANRIAVAELATEQKTSEETKFRRGRDLG
jgi:hypothetical protein